jgi:hypothetical protein
MAEQYSGDLIVGLLQTVQEIVPRPGKAFPISAEQHGMLTLMRQAILDNGQETPLKSAWLSLIDQCLSGTPTPEALENVRRLTSARFRQRF